MTKQTSNTENCQLRIGRHCDYTELQRSIEEVSQYISKSKEPYYDCLDKNLNNPKASPRTYWAIMKTFYNGKKIPLIHLL